MPVVSSRPPPSSNTTSSNPSSSSSRRHQRTQSDSSNPRPNTTYHPRNKHWGNNPDTSCFHTLHLQTLGPQAPPRTLFMQYQQKIFDEYTAIRRAAPPRRAPAKNSAAYMNSGDIFVKMEDRYRIWLNELESMKREGGYDLKEVGKCIALLWWHLVCYPPPLPSPAGHAHRPSVRSYSLPVLPSLDPPSLSLPPTGAG